MSWIRCKLVVKLSVAFLILFFGVAVCFTYELLANLCRVAWNCVRDLHGAWLATWQDAKSSIGQFCKGVAEAWRTAK